MPKYKTPDDGIKKHQRANKDTKLAINRTKKAIRQLESDRSKVSGADRARYTKEIARLKSVIKEMS